MLLDRLYYELGFDTKASEAGLKRLYSGMTSVLGTLAKWGSIAGAVLGFAKAVNEAKKEYLEFETGARRIWTLLDVSEQELRSYTGALLDMTTKIPQSIGTLEKAMYDAISSNIDLGDSMEFIEQSSRGAIAGMTDVATAVDLNTTILNAYEMKVKDVADVNDVLFVGVDKGKVTYEEFASNLGSIIPTAASLGVELESLVAAISAMTLGGISADNAVTYLNQVLVSVLNPTKEAREEAEKYGIELSQTALQAKGLLPFLSDLKEAVGDNGESMAVMFGNVRALRSVLSLTGPQLDDFNRIMGEMGERAGATEDAYAKMVDSTANKVQTLSNTWSAIGVLLWEKVNPAFRDSIDVLNFFSLGIKEFLDDSYKLRDMFIDLDRDTGAIAAAIEDVGKKVESANSVMNLYSGELDRVKGDADQFGSALEELTELVDQHNFAVSTGEGDYSRLRESIEKLVEKNPELIGMYEAEGEMLKLNIELIKAEIDARISLMEIKKLELKETMDEQTLEVEKAQKRLVSLKKGLDEAMGRKDYLEPLREGLTELISQIDKVRSEGVFGKDAIEEADRILTFLDEYEDHLIKENALSGEQIENIRKEAAEIKRASEAYEKAMLPFAEAPEDVKLVAAEMYQESIFQMTDRTKKLFAALPTDLVTNFDSELDKLNKTIAESGVELDKINDELDIYTKKVDYASKAIGFTDISIAGMEAIKDSIGTADKYWSDWFEKERKTYERLFEDYKHFKDSEAAYDQEIANQSFMSAKSTAQKIRLYAIRQGDETAAAWADSQLKALSEIEKANEETYESMRADSVEYYNRQIANQKKLITDIKAAVGESPTGLPAEELRKAEEGLARLFVTAFGRTGDKSFLDRIETETNYTLDSLLSKTEKVTDQLAELYKRKEEVMDRYYRALSIDDTDTLISMAGALKSVWTEIYYTADKGTKEWHEGFAGMTAWGAQVLALSGETNKVTKELADLIALYNDYLSQGRLDDALRITGAIESLARSQYELSSRAGEANREWLDVADEYISKGAEIKKAMEGGGKTFFETISEDLEKLEKKRGILRELYKDAARFGETDQLEMLMKMITDVEDQIINMLYSASKESADYNIFELLTDKAIEYGRVGGEIIDLTGKKINDNLEWEKEKLAEIEKLEKEIAALREEGLTDEANTKLRRLADLNLEIGLHMKLQNREQSKFFEHYVKIHEELNSSLQKTTSFMERFLEMKDLYYAAIAHPGEVAEEAGRSIAGSIANLFEVAYQESVKAGSANEAYWKGYEFWVAKSRKDTDQTIKKIQDLQEELENVDKKLEEAQEKGLWDVASKFAQERITILSSLTKLADGFIEDYQAAFDKKAEIDKKLEDSDEVIMARTIQKLETDLSEQIRLKEEAKEALQELDRELQEERDRLLEEGKSEKEIEEGPAIQDLQARAKVLEEAIAGYTKSIEKLSKQKWELTGDTEDLSAWVEAGKAIKEVAEDTATAWEKLRRDFEFMVADSERLSGSTIAQLDALIEMMGGALPTTGRASYIQEMFGVTKTEALQILKYYEDLEKAADNEAEKLLKNLKKAIDDQYEETLDRVKASVDKILSWDFMTVERRIHNLNVFKDAFEGTEAEKLAVTKMINEEIEKLEKQAFEDKMKKLRDQSEAESEARIEGAKDAIKGISENERLSIQERIGNIKNYLMSVRLSTDEWIQIEKDANEKIKALQMELDNELERRAKKIPQTVNYKARLDLLDQYLQESLTAVEDNERAKFEIEEKYHELRELMREEETERIRGYIDERFDLFTELATDIVEAVSEGGEGAGIRFLEAMFNGVERIVQHYVKSYVIEPILDEVAKATAEFEEQGMDFSEALTQGISAALTGNFPQLLLTALIFNLSQMKWQFEIFWKSLKNLQIGWLQGMIKDLEWFFGGSAKAIEDLKQDIENALMRSDSLESFGENLEATIKDRIKQGIITAFLETAAMKALFKKIADAMQEAMKDEEVTTEEWEEIKRMIEEAVGNAKEVFENLPDDFWGDLPEFNKPSNTVKSITEETANVLLAIERSSNLYLREMNENLRVVKDVLKGWDGRTPPRDTGFNTQQTMRSHGLW